MKEQDRQLDKRSQKDDDRVRNHYEKWPFPDLAFGGREGLILLRHLHELLDSTESRTKQVVDIGCGTGHGTITIARHFPDVNFVGLDLSAASIQIAQHAAGEAGLSNIDFRQGDICDPNSLPNVSFDLALCAGVLHHIPDSFGAFANLANLVAHDGVVILWFYSRHGRMRHNLNQAFIQLLARSESLDGQERIAREFVSQLGQQQVVNSGFYSPVGSGPDGLDWLLTHRQWLADQMIPPYEHCYTLQEILNCFHKYGISFRKWLGVSTKLERYTSSSLLLEEFNKLTPDEQLVAIDYLVKPEYYFVSGQKDRTITDDRSGNQRI